LRSSPRLSDTENDFVPAGSRVEILEQNVIGDGRVWIHVRVLSTGREGFLPYFTIAQLPSTSTSEAPTPTAQAPRPTATDGSPHQAVLTTENGMGAYLRHSPRMSDHDNHIVREGSYVEILEQDI